MTYKELIDNLKLRFQLTTTNAAILEFIGIAESELNLRYSILEDEVELSFTDGISTLPGDFIAVKSLGDYSIGEWSNLNDYEYAIMDNQIKIKPHVDKLKLHYLQKPNPPEYHNQVQLGNYINHLSLLTASFLNPKYIPVAEQALRTSGFRRTLPSQVKGNLGW